MVTYKNKQGKQVKGKVIHRHDGKDASHLTGHVNIQKIGGVPSFPVTVHVSDIKPHITEETDMQDENVYTMIDSIQTGDTERAETLFREIMNTKIADVLASNKEEVAKSMFNTNECADCESEEVDEALKGNQHKIDANKNGKVDGHDFKMLRKKKGVKEEAEQVDEDTFEQGGKMKTDTKPRHVSPHFKHLKKLSPAEFKADVLKRAGLTDVSKKSPAVKKEEVEYVDEYKLWRPEEQRSDKGNAFTKKGIEKGKTTPTAKQKEHGAKAVARYKINRGLSKDAKLEAYESKPGIVQSTWKSKVTGKVKPKKEHSPEDCPGCGAPTNNAEGGMCADCRA